MQSHRNIYVKDSNVSTLTESLCQPGLTSVLIDVPSRHLELLCEILSSPDCNIIDLNIISLGFKDNDLILLIEKALKNPHSKITKLKIPSYDISDKGFTQLIEYIKDHDCKLSSLTISDDLAQKRSEQLLAMLQDPKVKLKELKALFIRAYRGLDQKIVKTLSSNIYLTDLSIGGTVKYGSRVDSQYYELTRRNKMLPTLIKRIRNGDSEVRKELQKYTKGSEGFAADFIKLMAVFGDDEAFRAQLNIVLQYGVLNADISQACASTAISVFASNPLQSLAYLCADSKADLIPLVCGLNTVHSSKFLEDNFEYFGARSLKDFIDQLNHENKLAPLKEVLESVASMQRELGISEDLILNTFKSVAPEIVTEVLANIGQPFPSLFDVSYTSAQPASAEAAAAPAPV